MEQKRGRDREWWIVKRIGRPWIGRRDGLGEWLIAGYFLSLLISWVRVFLNGRSKICLSLSLSWNKESNPACQGQSGKKENYERRWYFFKGSWSAKRFAEPDPCPDCVTQAGPARFRLPTPHIRVFDILVKIAGNKIIGESEIVRRETGEVRQERGS